MSPTPPLLLLLLLLLPLTTTVSASDSATCTLTQCAELGARHSCTLPGSSSLPTSTAATTCAGWALGPPPLDCSHDCSTVCLSDTDRPVASDGIAYCTDCSLVSRSCRSAFSVVGPVLRGVHNALALEEEQEEGGQGHDSLDDGPMMSDEPADPSDEPDFSEEPGPDAEPSNDPPMMPTPLPSPDVDSDDLPMPTAEATVPALPQEDIDPTKPSVPCRNATTASQRALCCRHNGSACAPLGLSCSSTLPKSSSSEQDPDFVSTHPHPPCARGVVCVLTDLGPMPQQSAPTGTCATVASAPACTVPECGRHGAWHVCALNLHTVTTCAAWATRRDGGRVPICDRVCTMECVTGAAKPVASDGSRHCSVCRLLEYSCRRDFSAWGPVEVGPQPQ